jgi:exodeoxyribonuclease VII large subunit
MSKELLTVTQLCEITNELLSALGEVFFSGEVTGFTKSYAGHMYFTLKDKDSQISCVMFSRDANSLKREIKNGDVVECKARVSVYKASGRMQCIVKELESGLEQGDLYKKFLQLKKKLEKQGFFDSCHKVSLPKYPTKIAVVTSATGAVIHDIQTTLSHNFPIAKIYNFDCLVQGGMAEDSVLNAFKMAQDHPDNMEVIIIGRGGGSMEDLMVFNSEKIVKEIFECKIPVVSAVGHESDFSLTDFVADVRAPTPTAAANIVCISKQEIFLQLEEAKKTMHFLCKAKIEKNINHSFVLSSRLEKCVVVISESLQRINQLSIMLNSAIDSYMVKRKHKIAMLEQSLSKISPKNILNKGYCFVKGQGDGFIKSVFDVKKGDSLNIYAKDGVLDVEVKKITTDK